MSFIRPDALLPPKKEEVNKTIDITWQDNGSIKTVLLRYEGATYEACIVDGVMYDGMLSVPEEKRRSGIATYLIQEVLKIAKERGINEIEHIIQSVEGLLLVTNVLKQRSRRFFLDSKTESSFEEAREFLQRKIDNGKQDDTSIMVSSTTYLDALE